MGYRNPEDTKRNNATYYARNKSRIAAKGKVFYLQNKERVKARSREYKRGHPGYAEDSRLRRTYGITIGDYERLFADQSGVCAICKKVETIHWRVGRAPKKLTVDHDHKTGRVRGLLCQRCNSILGYAEDEPLRLLEAVKYLGKP